MSGDKYLLKFANSGEAAIRMVREEVPSIILTDINFGAGINGFQVSQEIRKISKSPAIVALSGSVIDR